jgi:hypothetical protein
MTVDVADDIIEWGKLPEEFFAKVGAPALQEELGMGAVTGRGPQGQSIRGPAPWLMDRGAPFRGKTRPVQVGHAHIAQDYFTRARLAGRETLMAIGSQ